MSATAIVQIILVSFGLFSGFGVLIFFFGSMLSDQPLQLKEAVVAALLLALLGTVAATIVLIFRDHGLGARSFLYLSVATSIVTALLVLEYECSIHAAILMTLGASILTGVILAVLRTGQVI